MEVKMKKANFWDDYEKELLAKGKITEEEIMIEKLKMDFARLLYNCRNHRKLTQKGLARKMDVRQQYIAKIESGEENLTLETIGKLLLALKSVLKVDLVEKKKITEGILEYA